MNTLIVHVTFTEPVLGSSNNNPEVLTEHIKAKAEATASPEFKHHATKAPTTEKQQEEIQALGITADLTEAEAEEMTEKQTTIFPKNPDGSVFCWDYQIRGFFKEALWMGCEIGEPELKSLSKWTIKKCVDSLLFVAERRIPFLSPDNQPITKVEIMERPMRVTTMRGERVCLARSEVVPAGAKLTFTLKWLEAKSSKSKYFLTQEAIVWALNYAALKGFGQWRSGGYGRFTYTLEDPKKDADTLLIAEN